MARKLVARALWAAGSAELVPRLKLQSSIPSLRSESYLTDHCCFGRSKKKSKQFQTTRLSHAAITGAFALMKGTGRGSIPRRRPRTDGKLHSRHRAVSPVFTFRYNRGRPDSAGSAKAPASFPRSPRAPDRAIQIPLVRRAMLTATA